MAYHTERIWSLQGDELKPRDGHIVLDIDNAIVDADDALGPLHVSEGLEPGDVAVFMTFTDEIDTSTWDEEKPDMNVVVETIGYLVVHQATDPEGADVLVSRELIERHPETWLSGQLVATWNHLATLGYTPEEFVLPNLTAYLEKLRQKNQA